MRAFTFYILSFICLLGIGSVSVSAQSLLSPNGGAGGVPQLEEKVTYDLLPTRPNVGDTVDIEAKMYGTAVKNAIFSWFIDGKLYKKEQGLNMISVYVNKGTKVNVSILTVTGATLSNEWIFNPEQVKLIWEANTYTPPFYKGKALYTAESAMTFNAINLDAKNPLTNKTADYVWKTDGVVQGSKSGVSKNTYVYQGDILQYEPLFELLYTGVTNFNQIKAGQKASPVNVRSTLRVQTLESDVFTYEKVPLLGVLFNKKINTIFPVTKPEVTLVSFPVYYSVESALIPEYVWLLNDSVIKRDSNMLSFKKTKDDVQSRLTISVSNPKSLLQSQNISHVIDTTTKVESSLFGGFGN